MESGGDRLSSLPDDLIHKILSFIRTKHAIQTSILSSKWRYIWTSLSYLIISSDDFLTLPSFSKFVTHVLSSRNNQVDVSHLKLSIRGKDCCDDLVEKIMNYALSHNIQQLKVVYLDNNEIEFPLSLYSCRSLKHLTLTCYYPKKLASTWDLPALTTLHLDGLTVYTDKYPDIFFKCANLKNLRLTRCRMYGAHRFRICHPQLSHLTLVYVHGHYGDVIAPQLENLTIVDCELKHTISAPNLASLLVEGDYSTFPLSTDGFSSLEKVDLCIDSLDKIDAHKIVCLLEPLKSVKYLALNLEIVEVLSSSMEQISHQPSLFTNLKSLKIYPNNHRKVQSNMSTEAVNYLLDSSPNATLTMVSREEARAAKNATSAQNHMAELRVLLEKEKANIETNMAHMKQRNAQPELKTQLPVEERMVEKSYWRDLNVQLKETNRKIRDIIKMLGMIEGLLTELPTSQRDKMQAKFDSLCEEADPVINSRMDCMKIQCHNTLSPHFHSTSS